MRVPTDASVKRPSGGYALDDKNTGSRVLQEYSGTGEPAAYRILLTHPPIPVNKVRDQRRR
jgi:hypothetical protein